MNIKHIIAAVALMAMPTMPQHNRKTPPSWWATDKS